MLGLKVAMHCCYGQATQPVGCALGEALGSAFAWVRSAAHPNNSEGREYTRLKHRPRELPLKTVRGAIAGEK